jgi:hypothetical protein
MKKNPVGKRREAEVASEHYCREVMDCIATRRMIKNKWHKVDFFSCDVVGKRADGSHVYIQVTAGQTPKVLERKKKLENEVWHTSDTVQILQLVQTDNPGKGSRKLWFFRVYEYQLSGDVYEATNEFRYWKTYVDGIPVPKEWFKKWRSPDSLIKEV